MSSKSCAICKYSKFDQISSHVRDSIKHKILKCRKCSHVQLYPVPSPSEDKEFYDKDMQNKNIKFYGNIEDHRRKSIDDTIRRVNFIRRFTPKNGKILEVGSGHGFFVELMRKKKYNITGIEISIEKRMMSKKVTRAKILDIDINMQSPDIGNFDTIVMFHVLEHIADPISFLKNVKKLLKPKGKLIVEVPNYDDFQLELNKSYREFYWQRAHLHYFTPKNLRCVFSFAGFKAKISGVQRYSIENMISWKLTNKPQLNEPTYSLPEPYEWIEKSYKQNLEKNLKCDTIMSVGTV
ncbi:MAG TPA: class I SAM-dependent methyltransferase [Nitrosopumilaceae archaeon]|nr:class I SAM-dependent methyltransferase [Nitrosopumilaceae archaeon]